MIILASGSPRRKSILSVICSNFEVRAPKNEENSTQKSPVRLVLELARAKAREIAQGACENDVIIAADTIVWFQSQVFTKPKTAAEAALMLSRLSANIHHVYTGVCLMRGGKNSAKKRAFCVKSAVTFNSLSAAEIKNYIDSDACMDKAGAYGIQDCNFVKNVRGSFTNVMGLPLEKLSFELKAFTKGEN